MTIHSVKADHYRIPLGVTLSDATHGEMSSFEFVTVRLETDSGLEGIGFTYTTGSSGAAIRSLIERELLPVLIDSDEVPVSQTSRQWDVDGVPFPFSLAHLVRPPCAGIVWELVR